MKAVQKHLLQFNRLMFNQGVLHHLYINNDVQYHQLILPIKYQEQMLQMLHDSHGHQGMERTITLCNLCFYWNTVYKDIAEYMNNCLCCQVVRGHYVGPKTKPGSLIANGSLVLLCIDFTEVDLSRDSKEVVLVFTDAFSKFSEAFVASNQKALTMAKIIVEKWLYIFGVQAHIHSDKGHSFDNDILDH